MPSTLTADYADAHWLSNYRPISQRLPKLLSLHTRQVRVFETQRQAHELKWTANQDRRCLEGYPYLLTSQYTGGTTRGSNSGP